MGLDNNPTSGYYMRMNNSTYTLILANAAAKISAKRLTAGRKAAGFDHADTAAHDFALAADHAGQAAQLFAQAGDIQRAMAYDGARRMAELAPAIYIGR